MKRALLAVPLVLIVGLTVWIANVGGPTPSGGGGSDAGHGGGSAGDGGTGEVGLGGVAGTGGGSVGDGGTGGGSRPGERPAWNRGGGTPLPQGVLISVPEAARVLRGVVVGPRNEPVAQAQLDAMTARGRGWTLGRSGEDGAFALEVPQEVGGVWVGAEGYVGTVAPVPPQGPWRIQLREGRVVEGRVVSAADQTPLEGVEVTSEDGAWWGSTQTDAAGWFRLQAPDGSLRLRLEHPTHVPGQWVSDGPSEVALERGRTLRGRVIGPDGGRPQAVPEVVVVGSSQLGRPLRATAAADGTFELVGGLGEDEEFAVLAWTAWAATPNFLDWQTYEAEELEVQLSPRGRVEILEGVPLGCGLRALSGAPDMGINGPSDGFGWEVAAGTYTLTRKGAPWGEPFEVVPYEVVPLDLPDLQGEPREGPPLFVRVLDGGGVPLEGVRVLAEVGASEWVFEARTDARGEVVFRPPGGPVTCAAFRDGWVLEQPGFRDAGEREPVELTLLEQCTLEGRARPEGFVAYQVLDEAGAVVLEQISEDGRFQWTQLSAGRYTVAATRRGYQPLLVDVTLPLNRPLELRLVELGPEPGGE